MRESEGLSANPFPPVLTDGQPWGGIRSCWRSVSTSRKSITSAWWLQADTDAFAQDFCLSGERGADKEKAFRESESRRVRERIDGSQQERSSPGRQVSCHSAAFHVEAVQAKQQERSLPRSALHTVCRVMAFPRRGSSRHSVPVPSPLDSPHVSFSVGLQWMAFFCSRFFPSELNTEPGCQGTGHS